MSILKNALARIPDYAAHGEAIERLTVEHKRVLARRLQKSKPGRLH
jgi:hypothetical protein